MIPCAECGTERISPISRMEENLLEDIIPGIGYADMQRAGIYAPVYDVKVRYYAPLFLNERVEIHTHYLYKLGARLDYTYQVYRESDHTLCAEGSTTQLFIDAQGELMTELPSYYQDWQRQYLSLDEPQ